MPLTSKRGEAAKQAPKGLVGGGALRLFGWFWGRCSIFLKIIFCSRVIRRFYRFSGGFSGYLFGFYYGFSGGFLIFFLGFILVSHDCCGGFMGVFVEVFTGVCFIVWIIVGVFSQMFAFVEVFWCCFLVFLSKVFRWFSNFENL